MPRRSAGRARRAGHLRLVFRLGAPIWVCWVAETALGAYFGRFVNPHALGLDLLLPIYFLGLVMGFRKRAGCRSWRSAPWLRLPPTIVGSPWHVSSAPSPASWSPDCGDHGPATGGEKAYHGKQNCDTVWIILAGAVMTYLTRIGGHRAVALRAYPSARRGRPQRGAGGGADDAGGAGCDGWRADRAPALASPAWSRCAAACWRCS